MKTETVVWNLHTRPTMTEASLIIPLQTFCIKLLVLFLHLVFVHKSASVAKSDAAMCECSSMQQCNTFVTFSKNNKSSFLISFQNKNDELS